MGPPNFFFFLKEQQMEEKNVYRKASVLNSFDLHSQGNQHRLMHIRKCA